MYQQIIMVSISTWVRKPCTPYKGDIYWRTHCKYDTRRQVEQIKSQGPDKSVWNIRHSGRQRLGRWWYFMLWRQYIKDLISRFPKHCPQWFTTISEIGPASIRWLTKLILLRSFSLPHGPQAPPPDLSTPTDEDNCSSLHSAWSPAESAKPNRFRVKLVYFIHKSVHTHSLWHQGFSII